MIRSMTPLFQPKSIAVVGVSRSTHKLGRIVYQQLIHSHYPGTIIGINPQFEAGYKLDGHTTYPSVSEAKQDIDLAILAIPGGAIKDALIDCGYAGVKSAIIFSSGFREVGAAGLQAEEHLIEIANRYGIRLLGPNCLGFVRPKLHLNATFLDLPLLPGNVGMISQSGALGSAILDWAKQQHLGFSFFASLGNKADLNELDFLEAAFHDKDTELIAMYLESISDGQALLKLLKQITPHKPVIVLKPGASQAAQAAIVSHTGHLAGSDAALDSALRQSGALRAHTMAEFFMLTKALSRPVELDGRHITIVTNAGGPAVLATDALDGTGLQLTALSQKSQKSLAAQLPSAASTHNPIDVLGDAPADRYQAVLHQLINTPTDAVIAILTPQATTEIEKTAEVLAQWSKRSGKPVAAAFLGGQRVEGARAYLDAQGIPVFDFPETAVKILALALHLHQATNPTNSVKQLDRATIKSIHQELGRYAQQPLIQSPQTNRIFAALGLKPAPGGIVDSIEKAEKAVKELGYPVVLKRVGQEWHKTEDHALVTHIRSRAELVKAYKKLKAHPGQIFIEKMIMEGIEVFVGAKRDPDFGALIAFGLGGIYTEVYRDMAFGVPPLSKADALALIDQTRTAQVLHGVRGQAAKNVDALANLLVQIAKLMQACPEIAELDLNPVIVTNHQAFIVDAKLKLIK